MAPLYLLWHYFASKHDSGCRYNFWFWENPHLHTWEEVYAVSNAASRAPSQDMGICNPWYAHLFRSHAWMLGLSPQRLTFCRSRRSTSYPSWSPRRLDQSSGTNYRWGRQWLRCRYNRTFQTPISFRGRGLFSLSNLYRVSSGHCWTIPDLSPIGDPEQENPFRPKRHTCNRQTSCPRIQLEVCS